MPTIRYDQRRLQTSDEVYEIRPGYAKDPFGGPNEHNDYIRVGARVRLVAGYGSVIGAHPTRADMSVVVVEPFNNRTHPRGILTKYLRRIE